MCGIFAVSSSSKLEVNTQNLLHSMAHRGPDANGSFVSELQSTHLGHVRLSILDLSDAGKQPMPDHSGRYMLSYNGEVYNSPELRRDLESQFGDIPWRSTSDTEVIVEGYARLGKAFLSRLNGMFALAIYDKQDDTTLLLRDPVGIKPLYLYQSANFIAAASEVKVLKQLPEVSLTLRRQSIVDSVSFMYVPEPHTMYEEVTKVEPGKYYICRAGSIVDSGELYQFLNDPIAFNSDEEWVEELDARLAKAVKSQLNADVPVSLFLSGGLDSSLVTAMAKRHEGIVSDAYTISFSAEDAKYDGQSDDLHYARIMADKFGIKLNVIQAEKNLLNLLPEMMPFLEDGIADPAAINTWLICKGARENGIKVLLSGQGADEYIGGYRRYLAEAMMQKMPDALLKLIGFGNKLLPSNLPGRLNGINRRLKRFGQAASMPIEDRLLSLYMWNDRPTTLNLFKNHKDLLVGDDHLSLFRSLSGIDTVSKMMKVDQKYDLMSLNLAYTDKMSMMASVETRVPFLDFDVVQLCNALPASLKLRGKQQKYALKKVAESYLPHEVIYRQKAGFALPIRSWFKSQQELVEDYLSTDMIKRTDVFDIASIERVKQEQAKGTKDHSYTLFSLLCMQIWLNDVA